MDSDNDQIENIGWTLGNDCPYKCKHCYSNIVRNRGRCLEITDVYRIIEQIKSIGVKTVNLGGNEPIFTGGLDPNKTVLPYIIRSLHDADIAVGLTTAGISLLYLERMFPDTVPLLNDVDVSLDSPFADEHNKNRGATLFNIALKALGICRDYDIDRTIIMCGMNWNLTARHIDALVELAREQGSMVRINFMKPTEPGHMNLLPSPKQFYFACDRLMSLCKVVDMSEPLIPTMCDKQSRGCPCGTKSFRIHSINPAGKIPISPCVYVHDHQIGDLLTDELADLIKDPKFCAFKNRRSNPESIQECNGCQFIKHCRGGCTARAYLWSKFVGKNTPIRDAMDPYCLRNHADQKRHTTPEMVHQDKILVHRDYLCTIILDPSK